MAANNNDLTEVYRAYQELLTSQQSLTLATINQDGTPLVSYAPFIVTEEKQFYIFISQLAGHTANLQRGGQLSLMLIEDETAVTQIFARRRLIFQSSVESVPRDSPEGSQALDQYQARFGNMVKMLRSLPDFQLFKLSPSSGRLILGFGQAYDVGGPHFETLTHRRSG